MFVSLFSDNAHNWRRWSATPRRRLAALALLPALLSLTGCAEKWVEVFPVSGTVKYNGQVPDGARIVLHAVNPAGPDAVVPSAGVKSDGSFTVTSYKAGDGAPPGDYVLTIQWFKFDDEAGGAGPNVIPAQYASPKTSPIKVSVQKGGPTVVDPIAITGKAAKTASVARRAF